ncbi:hypothetical protein ASF72_10290 [Arthrobacter sp. Leaf141]|nr:hypothetical protein ASF72_10290 [Arthrobacter sp. Leaf141]
MLVKRLVLIGAAAAIVLGGSAVALDSIARQQADSSIQAEPGGRETAGGSGTMSAAPPPGTPASEPAAQPAESPNQGAGEGQVSGDRPPPGVAAGVPEPDEKPLEVLPPATAPPTGLPMPAPLPALIRAPLPATASAQGKTVDGFPSQVLSFPEGTVIVFTGVSSDGDRLQATAEGIVGLSRDEVAGYFQQILQPKGFTSEDAASAADQQARRLSRGTDSVSVTLSTTGTGSTRFSLLGNFTAGPAA